MKSAREMAAALLETLGVPLSVASVNVAAEVIQQSREDGARWTLEQVEKYESIQADTVPPWDVIDHAYVRKVAP